VTIFLVYHEVSDEPVARGVSPRDLERHVQMIRSSGAEIVTPRRLGPLDRDRRSFVFCFDDGTTNHGSVVPPILARHDVNGIFYVPTQKLGLRGRLTAAGMKELHEAGHTIGVHGHTHDRWDRLSVAALRKELQTSRSIIADVCGVDSIHAAPPGGYFTPAAVEVARTMDFAYFRTMRWGFNRNADPFAIEVLPMTRVLGDWFIRSALSGGTSLLVDAAYRAKCAVRAVRS
jgi:peptidoglycan/xylan/chitin deacetylase (PgdA/CDA1 family)